MSQEKRSFSILWVLFFRYSTSNLNFKIEKTIEGLNQTIGFFDDSEVRFIVNKSDFFIKLCY
jgi:hypothetical protein